MAEARRMGKSELFAYFADKFEWKRAQAMEMGMKARAAVAEQPSLNMEVQHSKTVQVNVEIWYRVSEFVDRKFQFPGTSSTSTG